MPLYKYTVTNKEGKKLTGSIDAPDEISARTELNNMGFSILEISQTEKNQEELEKGHLKFEFEALDANTKKIKGSIPASSKESALQRLDKEYNLTILAIWPEGSSQELIDKAREEGKSRLELEKNARNQSNTEIESTQTNTEKQEQKAAPILSQEEKQKEQFVKQKIETVLKRVSLLIKKFETEFDKDIKTEINKKINKILRIKSSKNLEYILSTAKDLLLYIQTQEKELEKKGYHDKRFQLTVDVNSILDDLNKTQKPKSLSEDIKTRIQKWRKKHKNIDPKKQNKLFKFTEKITSWLEQKFTPPPEIQALKQQIQNYKQQRFDFIKLLIKKPTKYYRTRTITAIKDLNEKIKDAKEDIKKIKEKSSHSSTSLQNQSIQDQKPGILTSITKELNHLTAWLLAIYLIYYFIALFLSTKDLGFAAPKGFQLYQSQLYKYILLIIFFLHAATSTKLNYFPKNRSASLIIPPLFIIITLITIVNF